MKRSTDTRKPSGGLPSFLGSESREDQPTSATGVTAATSTNPEDSLGADERQEQLDESELDEGQGYAGEDDAGQDLDYETDEDDFDDDDEEGFEEEEVQAAAPRARVRPASRSRRRYQPTPPPVGGSLAMGTGLIVTIAGFVAACVPAATAAMNGVIEPQIIALLGIALFGIGAAQRRVGRMQQRLDGIEQQRAESDQELRETMAQLLDRDTSQAPQATTNADSAEVQQMLLSLQRQDQKINNLTKAIKMYGKPLMDIAGQGTELAGSVSQVKALVEGAAETTRQAINRVEQTMRGSSPKADLGDLPTKITKLEVSLAAMAQRLEDTEVRKSLVRLEDGGKELRTQIDQLQSSETVREATTELQQTIDKATTGLSKGIEQLRDGNLTGLESSVKEIRRELSGLATGMSQIQAAVKSGVKVAGNAAQPAPPAAANPSSTSDKAAATGKASAPPKSSSDADGGYSTGARNSGGKNVLGAIAKLKQMKG